MRLIDTRSNLPLARDPASRFVPWIIGLMVHLAALALAAAMVLAETGKSWRHGLAGAVTVQIAVATDGAEASIEPRVQAALALLRATQGILAADSVPEDKVMALLEPWLGAGGPPREVPIPRLIAVEIAPGAVVDTGLLGARLAATVPGATLDDHGLWLDRLTAFFRGIELTAATIVFLVAAAAIGTVVYTTHATLAIHRETIEIMHLIGARDSYIARQFETHAAILGAKGGAGGLLVAIATLLLLGLAARRIDAALIGAITLGAAQWALLAMLPVIAGAISMVTARLTVLRALARLA